MGIYDRVKIAAERKGISINKLEKDLKLPRSSVSKYNKNQPSSIKISMIADYLGTTSDFLLGKTEDPSTYFDKIIIFETEESAETAKKILRSERSLKILQAYFGATVDTRKAVDRILEIDDDYIPAFAAHKNANPDAGDGDTPEDDEKMLEEGK